MLVCDGNDSVREACRRTQVIPGLCPEFWARHVLHPMGFPILYFALFLYSAVCARRAKHFPMEWIACASVFSAIFSCCESDRNATNGLFVLHVLVVARLPFDGNGSVFCSVR